jgi:hypothetical protein
MPRWAAGFLATMLVTGLAHAQPVLSDNELFASYCLGYLKENLRLVIQVSPANDPCVETPGIAPHCAKINDLWRQAYNNVQTNIGRLRSYLLVRGVLTLRDELPILVGFKTAIERGAADQRACGEHAITDYPNLRKDYPECVRASRCEDLSRIPF